MLLVPSSLNAQYVEHLKLRQVVAAQHVEYKKWLRYFLDFCNKYSPPDSKSEQIRLFCEKLRAKRQSESQCRLATHAVSLFFEMRQDNLSASSEVVDCPEEKNVVDSSTKVNETSEKWLPVSRGSSGYTEAGYQERSDSPEWDELLAVLASEIKVRHYSRKTLKTYANWSRQFQRFLKNKSPEKLSTSDVKDYLTFLAVKCRVAA